MANPTTRLLSAGYGGTGTEPVPVGPPRGTALGGTG